MNHDAAELLLHNKKKYEEKVKKYVKLYAKDKDDEEKKEENIKDEGSKEKERKNSWGDYLHKKNSRSHSLSIDLTYNYNFYEDENDTPIYDNDDDKSIISSNSSLSEELNFGNINN